MQGWGFVTSTPGYGSAEKAIVVGQTVYDTNTAWKCNRDHCLWSRISVVWPSFKLSIFNNLMYTCSSCSHIGKRAKLQSFYGPRCMVRRADGASISAHVCPYPFLLFEHVAAKQWDQALRLCRHVNVSKNDFTKQGSFLVFCDDENSH